MINRLRAAAALVLIAIAGSCRDATLSADEGVMRFEYSGAFTGKFNARGSHPDRAYAEGISSSYGSVYGAFGALFRDGVIRQMFVQLPATGNRVGRYSFGPAGDEASGGFHVSDPLIGEKSFGFVSGTVEVTAIDEKRMRGRFEGTVQQGQETVQIRGGSFDVPLRGSLSDLPWASR